MRVWHAGYLPRKPTSLTVLTHFLKFAAASLDRLAAWSGNIPLATLGADSITVLDEVAADTRGAFVITAHLGNPEAVRAIATTAGRAVINVLTYTKNAQLFNRLIHRFSPDAQVQIIDASNVGPETALLLAERIARGEWIVVAGDRLPPGSQERTVGATLLGQPASFPQGPFILGSILKCPAYLMFCLREKNGFRVHFSRFADPIVLPRRERAIGLQRYVASYARALEACIAEAPLQWFNFYQFWNETADMPVEARAHTQAAE